jgi:hypothetical protein
MRWMKLDHEGRVVEVIDADIAAGFYPLPRPELNLGDVLTDGDFALLGLNKPAVFASDRRVTKLAFRNRFTLAEKAALEIAQLDDPGAPMSQRAQAASLRANQADVAAATFIDLERPDTRSGVQALEAAGLIATGRAMQILDAPVEDDERFRG